MKVRQVRTVNIIKSKGKEDRSKKEGNTLLIPKGEIKVLQQCALHMVCVNVCA